MKKILFIFLLFIFNSIYSQNSKYEVFDIYFDGEDSLSIKPHVPKRFIQNDINGLGLHIIDENNNKIGFFKNKKKSQLFSKVIDSIQNDDKSKKIILINSEINQDPIVEKLHITCNNCGFFVDFHNNIKSSLVGVFLTEHGSFKKFEEDIQFNTIIENFKTSDLQNTIGFFKSDYVTYGYLFPNETTEIKNLFIKYLRKIVDLSKNEETLIFSKISFYSSSHTDFMSTILFKKDINPILFQTLDYDRYCKIIKANIVSNKIRTISRNKMYFQYQKSNQKLQVFDDYLKSVVYSEKK